MEDLVDFWLDRPVLVTGATGLVGGWVVRALMARRAQPVCLVRDWVPSSLFLQDHAKDQRATLVRGDICDMDFLERCLGEYEIETVLHLAAQTIVSIANRNPISTFQSNIEGTWNLLEACRRSPRVKQIIVASSDKAYGAQPQLPYDESMPLAGQHPYDVSKSCTDLISQCYAKTYGLPVAVTRCGNFYGGGDLNWNRIVPGTIRSVVRGKRPVIRSDGSFIRDYFYVEDGAATYLMLAEKLAANPQLAGEAFNFSNEIPVSVVDLVNQILQVMESDLQPEIRNEATNEIREQCLSSAKARSQLAWEPAFTLEQGLSSTVAWYRSFLETSQT